MVNLGDKGINAEESNNIVKVIKGSIVSILITLILITIFSALLTYTSINEKIIPITLIVITTISILIGSIMSSLHINKNGILNGGLVGLIYIAIIYLLSSIITGNYGLNLYSIIMIIASIMAGAVGGIIGINKK